MGNGAVHALAMAQPLIKRFYLPQAALKKDVESTSLLLQHSANVEAHKGALQSPRLLVVNSLSGHTRACTAQTVLPHCTLRSRKVHCWH